MSDDYLKSHRKILVDYEAINEIVFGAVAIMTIGLLRFLPGILDFAYHVAIYGILTMLRGFLLLYGIKKENRICVMVHIVLSILFLMLYKVAIIYEVISTLMDMHVYIDALFITVYFVLCPLLWAFFWYIQFCAFRFYQYLGNS
ncbi:hypothetical protein Zmor_016099 [Zophobas morio]|uniref:Transmembrane protein n=1 Tax=Zophobas morio TaxID=2755281 RepID=A0AA38MI49_9CUCU|nr:hypothetical protein Zmor_016099 [Zophobas morio]